MLKIYCKEGESKALVIVGSNPAPQDFLLMDCERPTNFHICKNSGNGKGKWVLDKNKLSKNHIYFMKNRKKIPYIIKVINKNKKTIFKILSKIDYRFLKNLFSLNDISKKITAIFFIINLIGIFITKENTSINNLFISMIAAPVFYFFISIIPLEFSKRKKAFKLGQQIGNLSKVKNTQYINIGYLSSTLKHKNMYEEIKDHSMNKDKAITLKNLIKLNINNESEVIEDNIKEDFRLTEMTNKDYFILSYKFLNETINKILKVEIENEFPKFYDLLIYYKESLEKVSKEKVITEFSDDYSIGKYIMYHFTIIEYIECLYYYECLNYSNILFGHFNYLKEFDNNFKDSTYHGRISFYF